MPVITNTMQWANVGIPLIQGVNTGIRARLADPTTLVIADNVYYPKVGGPEKRLGYDYVSITNPLATPTTSTEYTYGYGAGPFSATNFQYANPGNIKSIAERDTELVVQAEECLFNANKKISDRFHCFSATTKNIAKTQNSQYNSDMADNGVIKVVAFRDLENANVKVYCYDSVTGSLKFSATASPNDPRYIKVVPIGEYIHVYISNIGDSTLYLHPVFPGDTSLRAAVDLGECLSVFDVCKMNEVMTLVAKKSAAGILCGYVNPVGTTNASFASFNTAMDIGGATVQSIGVAIHPDLTVGLAWDGGATQDARTYTVYLTNLGTVQPLMADVDTRRITITPKINEAASFFWFCDSLAANTYVSAGSFDSSSIGTVSTTYSINLVGKSFSIGAAAFAWVCRPSVLQSSYLVINTNTEIVGKLEYGTAVSGLDGGVDMFSANVIGNRVHGAFNYYLSILNQPGIFHEASTKEYLLDFDFKPRPAQAGRCLYYPGAQMWCYDGERLTEQGFHFAVESPIMTPSNSTGSLTNSGEYYYLIYACHKNAQGEEVRGPAILSSKVTMGPADDTVTITANTIPTLHEGSYFLIYRNANAGTNWHLVTERNPASIACPKNTANPTWTFTDTISDVALVSRELDGFTTTNYLSPFSAPSCTIVSYGKDRLWAAGGEIPGSQVWPSRLFTQYDTPAFHPAISVDIDKSLDNVSAIGFVADYVVIFKRKKGYILFGDGLDNVLVGNQFQPQLSLTDVGAISPCVRSITGGLVFQSEGSYRIMEPGGKVVDIADPIKDYFGLCNGINIDIENTSLELYQSNCTLVWNYALNIWTRWTSTCDAISECNYTGVGNRVFIQGSNYTDDGGVYGVRIKTAPYSQSVPGRDNSSQIGNFQRVRRVSGVGEGEGTFTVNIYLDEKEYPSDSFTITKPDVTGTWGGGTWGSGFWGDSLGTGIFMNDDRMRWVKRLSTQKCTCIAIEVVYNGTEKGPIHTAFVLEYGTKNGIDRSH